MSRDKDPELNTIEVSGPSTIASKTFQTTDPPASESQTIQAGVSPSQLDAVDSPQDNLIPSYDAGTGQFDWVADQTGSGGYATPNGSTVADIATAIDNNEVVRLEPGTTYTNPDNATIEMGPDNNKTLFAWGAKIEVRSNPTIYMKEGGVDANRFGWHAVFGGFFEGTESPGEVAIQAEDSIRTKIFPRTINDCECAIALTNDDLWCEYNEVGTYTRNCETGLMLVGGDGSPPAGSSVTRTNGGAGSSMSFRMLRLNFNGKMRQSQSAQNHSYGIYMDEASPYAGLMHASISGGDSVTIMRYHRRFNGAFMKLHAEAPKGATNGGNGVVVDANDRGPGMMIARIGGGVETPFVNNTSEPVMYYDTTQEPSQAYGMRLMKDGAVYRRFYDKSGTPTVHYPGARQFEMSDNDIIS